MKKSLQHFKLLLFTFLISFSFFATNPVFSQSLDSANVFNMPIGFLRIGDQNYVGLRIQPELTFGKLGFGIDVPFFFNLEDGKLRKEEFQNGTSWFRLLSYVRWGRKEVDPFYIRLGTLNRNYLGFGILMNNYTNAASFERRKVGLTWDILVKEKYGLEGTYSDFNGTSNLLALRPYFRPLVETYTPIIETLEVGFSFVTDHDKNQYDSLGNRTDTRFIKEGITSWAADVGITLVNTNFLNIVAYTQYGRLGINDSLNRYFNRAIADSAAVMRPYTGPLADGYKGAGGFSIGTKLSLNLIADILNLEVRLERLWYQQHFMPQFFDAIYEIDKDAKLLRLGNTAAVNGTYAVLTASILTNVRITGGMQIPDKLREETPALVHLSLEGSELIPNVILQANYYKGGLITLADAFKLDERSLLSAKLGLKRGIFVFGVDYRWTFTKAEEDGVTRFKARSYIMPFFALNFPLTFGG